MADLKHAKQMIIKYRDGTETIVNYNELGEKTSTEEVKAESIEETAEIIK